MKKLDIGCPVFRREDYPGNRGLRGRLETGSLLPALDSKAKNGSQDSSLWLGVGPVVLPPSLDRPQIVTRLQPNEVQIAEFHRWAEPLGENLTRVLVDNLSVLLGTENVARYPWRRNDSIDYQVCVDVLRFDAEQGKGSILQARWSLFDSKDQQILHRGVRLITPVEGEGYEAIVNAMGKNIEKLSRDIASAVQTHSQGSQGSGK